MKNQILLLEDYQRIFETIYSVLHFVGLPPEKNCVYFSLIGAILLSEHYGKDFKSVSGMAAYFLNEQTNIVLAFAEKKIDHSYEPTINKFHSWIENEEFVIDFQAPLFPEMVKQKYGPNICDSRMFQKPIELQCRSPRDFKKAGDFFHSPDCKLSKYMVDNFAENQFCLDILNICNDWYIVPIEKMVKTVGITDQSNQTSTMRLIRRNIVSSW